MFLKLNTDLSIQGRQKYDGECYFQVTNLSSRMAKFENLCQPMNIHGYSYAQPNQRT